MKHTPLASAVPRRMSAGPSSRNPETLAPGLRYSRGSFASPLEWSPQAALPAPDRSTRAPGDPAADPESTDPMGNRMAHFLAPLEPASRSPHLVRRPGLRFVRDEKTHEIPRFRFVGPNARGDETRLGIFAAIHGDEPESALGLVRFLDELTRRPGAARGYEIHAYPVCNPAGFESATRHAPGGRDLNREFWTGSNEPEIRLLETELQRGRFHGIVSLHCDDTSHGLYGFLSGRQPSAVLSASLLDPLLRAAERHLPRNHNPRIDGFDAVSGVLWSCYEGVLRTPDGMRHTPFEITFETPQMAPVHLQVEAINTALFTLLAEFRKLLAFAPNL